MTIYYVAQLAAGTGDGSSYANRMSVATHNTRTFSAGDVIYLCGTINSRVVIPSSGAVGNRISYIGNYEGHPGVLTPDTSYGSIRGEEKDYITIDGLEIKNGTIGISFINNCNYITIKKCTIHDMDRSGSKGIHISSNTLPKERNSNIIIGGAPGEGNEIYNVGVDTGGVDIGVAHVDTATISYNECYGGEIDTGIDGITTNYCNDIIIEYNKLFNHKDNVGPELGEDGIDLKGCSNVHVRYNVVYGNRAGGILVNNSDAMKANCNNIYIYHNLIYGHRTNIVVSDVDENVYIWGNILYGSTNGQGISCTSTGSNIHIYNNTLVNNHGAKGDKFAIVLGAGSNYYIKNNIFYSDTHNDLIYVGDATNVNLDYNRYYYTSGAARCYWKGTYKTLAEMQALGQETNGTEGDPGLTNVEINDYTLAAGSACINTGTNLGATYDDALNPHTTDFKTSPPTVNTVDQDSQGTGWEIGAYVYGAVATPAKGQIVGLTHPASVENGAMCDINAAIKNIGELSGRFKTQILIDSILLVTSPEFTLAGGATSTDKIDPFKAPSSGESMDIIIKCIRSE